MAGARMVDADSLTEQHTAIREAMAEVGLTIDRGNVASHAPALNKLLNEIATKIREHLDVEDQDVYPLLVNSDDSRIEKIARQFQNNMGGLAEEFKGHFRRYNSDVDIVRDVAIFSYETRGIFERLRHRMRREEEDLYPLLAARD